jgi:hypothetical protein
MEHIKSFEDFVDESKNANITESVNYKQVQDEVFSTYNWDTFEKLINDSFLEEILVKFEGVKTSDIKKALNKLTDEILDTWKQTTEYEF